MISNPVISAIELVTNGPETSNAWIVSAAPATKEPSAVKVDAPVVTFTPYAVFSVVTQTFTSLPRKYAIFS